LELFLKLYRDIRYSLNPRFELELAISRLAGLPHIASPTALVRKIAQLREELLSGSVKLPARKLEVQPDLIATQAVVEPKVKPEASSSVAAIPAAAPPPPPIKQEMTARDFSKQDLPLLVSKLSSAPLLSQVAQAITEVHNEGGSLFLTFSTSFCQNKAQEHETKFRDIITEITGFKGPVHFACAEEVKQEAPTVDDPVISKIASVFRGEVKHQ